ncbi:hypothetical protein HAX54_050120, partial [Datura stramonium]|nr:hypothetical protein [Datura stramonium]
MSDVSSGNASNSPQVYWNNSPLVGGLLKMAQMARSHNAQLLKLAKSNPPMIQQAIKKAMKPMVDKLGVVENAPPVENRSLPDDWCLGYGSSSKVVSDEEVYHDNAQTIPPNE